MKKFKKYVKQMNPEEKKEIDQFRKFMRMASGPVKMSEMYQYSKDTENAEVYGPVAMKMRGTDGVFNGKGGRRQSYIDRINYLNKVGTQIDEKGGGYWNDKFFNRMSPEDPKSDHGKNAPCYFA